MKKIFLLVAAAAALTACDSDVVGDTNPVAARISATIGEGGASRASDTSWDPGDAIGITMSGDRYTNVRYTTATGSGEDFAGEVMYFQNKKDPVTLTAYYPFTGTDGTAPAVMEANTATQADQAKFDFLYASRTDVTGAEPNVVFTFTHKMSKLTLVFNNGTGAQDVRITSYRIDGLIQEGTFDPADGECAAKSDADAAPLETQLTGETDGVTLPSLIVFPQSTSGKEVTLTITDNFDQEYSCSLTFRNDRLESGNNYQYTVKVNKSGLTVDGGTIEDWNPIQNGEIEAN